MDWWGGVVLFFGVLNVGLVAGARVLAGQRKAIDHDVVAARLLLRCRRHDEFAISSGADTLRAERGPMLPDWWVTRSTGDGRVAQGIMDDDQLEAELGRWLRGDP